MAEHPREADWLALSARFESLLAEHEALRRRLQEQERNDAAQSKAQRMESLGHLAARIAHDFNNILTVIRGHASLVQTESGLPERAQRSLRQVAEAADRGCQLTGQLMQFGRRQSLQRRPADLAGLISTITPRMVDLLGPGITLELPSVELGLPPIPADVAALEQLLLRLTSNARDAMPAGGQVTLDMAVVTLSAENLPARSVNARPGQFVCLTFRDTGRGMDAATLSRIFEPFFTTKDDKRIAGHGLAAVYGIVAQHLGWIEVQSQLKVGTSIKIYLPVAGHSEVENTSKNRRELGP